MKMHAIRAGLLIMALGLVACYEPQEGCLDPEAENYLVSADDPCCCDYPDRGIILDLRWDTLAFRLNRDYENNFGDTFRITALRYAASGFRWYYGSEEVRVEDQLAGTDPVTGDPVTYPDDWILLEAGKETFWAGTVRRHGTVDSFRMNLGWGFDDPSVLMLNPPSGHPLDTARSPLFDRTTETWSALRLTVIYGNGSRDTSAIAIPMLDIPLEFQDPFSQAVGKDHTLRLTVTVDDWLGAVDWRKDMDSIREQIVGGMSANHILDSE